MNSKKWNLLILASAASLMLSACGHNDDNDNEPTSPYTGVWVNADAMSVYQRYGGDSKMFCRKVLYSYRMHGISEEYEIGLNAISVRSSGEVYEYHPTDRVTDKNYRKNNFIGVVANDGRFTEKRDVTYASYDIDYENDGYGVYRLPSAGNFSLTETNVMRVYTSNNARLTYIRSTDAEMLEYSHRLVDCMDGNRDRWKKRFKHREELQCDIDQENDCDGGKIE
ncbi:MAG TPA: hypothetical protein PKC28_11795 [Bdellovibrionales bacterium]|nr:hypothetical protein [Bdellovibrionales bacterium]